MRTAALLLLAGVLMTGAQVLLAAENVVTTIFKCKIDGVTTFSDRPCGQDAQPQTLDPAAINTYAPRTQDRPPDRSPSGGAQERLKNRNPGGASAGAALKGTRDAQGEAKRKESCARYARSLKEIRSKLRSGYTAKEGERLRMRAEKLRDSQRQGRCS